MSFSIYGKKPGAKSPLHQRQQFKTRPAFKQRSLDEATNKSELKPGSRLQSKTVAPPVGSQIKEDKRPPLETLLQRGLLLIQRAETENFQDRRPLKKATELFTLALRHYRRDFRPYLFLSYLYFLHQDLAQTRKYFSAAQQLAPNEALVFAFRDKIKTALAKNPTSLSHAKRNASIEQAGDKIQAAVIEHVKALTQLQPLAPTATISELESYAEILAQHQTQKEEFVHKLDALDKVQETQSLRRHLQPFEQYLALHHKHLQIARQCQNLEKGLKLLEKDVHFGLQFLINELSEPEPVWEGFEIQIDHYLDRLDRLADQLDEFEEQGVDTTVLTQKYHALSPLVERYVEILDAHAQGS